MLENEVRLTLTVFRWMRGLIDRLRWTASYFKSTIIGKLPEALFGASVGAFVAHPHLVADLKSAATYIVTVVAIVGAVSFYLHKFSVQPNDRVRELAFKVEAPCVIYDNVGQKLWTDTDVNWRIETGSNPIDYATKLRDVDPLVKHFLWQFVWTMKSGAESSGMDVFDQKNSA